MPTRYVWRETPTAWKRRGRTDIAIVGGTGDGKLTRTQREALVWGTYIPSTANRGLLPSWNANNLTPGPAPDANGEITLTTAGTTYTNRIFYGRVWVKAANVTFDNCWFAGWHPSFYCDLDGNGNIIAGTAPSGGIAGCLATATTDTQQHTMIDCVIDPMPWADPAVTTRPGNVAAVSATAMNKYLAYSGGIRGGHVTATRLEIRNVQDSWSPHQPRLNLSDASFSRMNYPLFHDPHFYQGPDFALPEGTHTDGVQSQTGNDIKIWRGYITGHHNAALMLKQEANDAELNRCLAWEISETILEDDGSSAGALINHSYDSNKPNGLFQGSSFHDLLLVERQAGGKVINRASQFAALYDNPTNRLVRLRTDGTGWDDLGQAPVTNA